MKCFMGIDAGTSGVKAVVINEDGEVLGAGLTECDLITPYPLWAEQNPPDWWEACKKSMLTAIIKSGAEKEIEAIGMTGQMLGSVCLNDKRQPTGNCMIWLDQRATEERDLVESLLQKDEMLKIAANYPLTGYWAPKLLWLKKNRPEEFQKIRTVLFPKDYLRMMLTGEVAAEVSDGAGSFLFDVPGRQWSKELFLRFGLPMDIVPQKLYESCDVAGYLKSDVASELGLRPGIPVIAGGGDQTAGAVGSGIVREGVVSAAIGTSGVVFAALDACVADKQPRGAMSFCHSVPGMWSLFGCTLAAGGSFKWLRDTLFHNEKESCRADGADVYDHMTSLAEKSAPGSGGLCFLPYLNGERTPYPDPNALGVFFGLSYRHGLPEICRSVMEGVTFSLRDSIEILKEYGIQVTEIRASGGGAKSRLWKQMQADIYEASVLTTNLEEGPSAGAAILAAVGSGCFGSVQKACDRIVKVVSRTEPNRKHSEQYNDYYQTYRALYPALKQQFAAQAGYINKWS